jgi:N-acyl-D-amino-acid deacylase
LEKKGIGANLIPIVGQSIIRAHVVGTENRQASRGEIRAQQELVREAMEQGARGMSSGRSYEPGCFAPTTEIIELARVVAEYGGVYTTHLRNEGEEVFAALEEAIDVGRRAGVPVEVSHHKTIGRANFGKVKTTLRMMEEAREEGVRISCDVYPFDYSQISLLYRTLPRKFQRMSPDEIYAGLGDRSFRDSIREEFTRNSRRSMLAAPSDYVVVNCPARRDVEWKTFDEIAGTRDVLDTILDLLVEAKMLVRVASRMNEEDVQMVIRHPMTAIGTDAWALDRDMGERFAVHPRHFASFPRVLGHYVRDVGLTSLEQMVKKVTLMPARKFGLSDRGAVKEGYWADLLVFDPKTIVDAATPEDPYANAPGIDYVIVNGKIALEKGTYYPVLAGKVLRR